MTQKELIDKINETASFIAKKTRTGYADFMVFSPEVANTFQDIMLESEMKNINEDRSKKLKDILDDKSV